jgi:8-oxo-dGTP diphosphatase
MTRASVLAAGGIVLRQQETPLIAVVRLSKRNEWVLPKGKLGKGETARAGAEREVVEETGHDVFVHEFLGTLAYESGGRSKVVHYWRMESSGEQAYELMDDVRAVDWLPLDAAVERLSREHEREFLAHVGPRALEAAALAQPALRSRAKQAVRKKRRSKRVVAAPPSFTTLAAARTVVSAPPDVTSTANEHKAAAVVIDPVEAVTSVHPMQPGMARSCAEAEPATLAIEREGGTKDTANKAPGRRKSLVQTVREWLRRAA